MGAVFLDGELAIRTDRHESKYLKSGCNGLIKSFITYLTSILLEGNLQHKAKTVCYC